MAAVVPILAKVLPIAIPALKDILVPVIAHALEPKVRTAEETHPEPGSGAIKKHDVMLGIRDTIHGLDNGDIIDHDLAVAVESLVNEAVNMAAAKVDANKPDPPEMEAVKGVLVNPLQGPVAILSPDRKSVSVKFQLESSSAGDGS